MILDHYCPSALSGDPSRFPAPWYTVYLLCTSRLTSTNPPLIEQSVSLYKFCYCFSASVTKYINLFAVYECSRRPIHCSCRKLHPRPRQPIQKSVSPLAKSRLVNSNIPELSTSPKDKAWNFGLYKNTRIQRTTPLINRNRAVEPQPPHKYTPE